MPTHDPAGAAVLRPEKTQAIIAAFYAELAERGFEGLAMDRVARRAGVGKAALYRRWHSKHEMGLELMSKFLGLPPAAQDTGSLRGDLQSLIDDVIAALADPPLRRMLTSLAAEARRSPDLGALLAERSLKPRRDSSRQMFERAIERGELPPDTDIELAQDLFIGPPYFRATMLDEQFPPGYAQRHTDAVLRALGATPTREHGGPQRQDLGRPVPSKFVDRTRVPVHDDAQIDGRTTP